VTDRYITEELSWIALLNANQLNTLNPEGANANQLNTLNPEGATLWLVT